MRLAVELGEVSIAGDGVTVEEKLLDVEAEPIADQVGDALTEVRLGGDVLEGLVRDGHLQGGCRCRSGWEDQHRNQDGGREQIHHPMSAPACRIPELEEGFCRLRAAPVKEALVRVNHSHHPVSSLGVSLTGVLDGHRRRLAS